MIAGAYRIERRFSAPNRKWCDLPFCGISNRSDFLIQSLHRNPKTRLPYHWLADQTVLHPGYYLHNASAIRLSN